MMMMMMMMTMMKTTMMMMVMMMMMIVLLSFFVLFVWIRFFIYRCQCRRDPHKNNMSSHSLGWGDITTVIYGIVQNMK